MKREETATLIAYVEGCYSREFQPAARKVWAEWLALQDREIGRAAVEAAMAASPMFPPSIPLVRQKAAEVASVELDEEDVWRLAVNYACSLAPPPYSYDCEVPDLVARVVHMVGPDVIRSSDEADHWSRERVLKVFRELRQRGLETESRGMRPMLRSDVPKELAGMAEAIGGVNA